MTTTSELPRVGVIGAGVMGSGIAQVLALAGCETVCFDISKEALDEAGQAVRGGRYGLDRSVELGKTSRDDADAALARLHFSDDIAEACAAEVIVECVPERLDLKIQTFRDLDRRAPEGAILASNTSGFSIAGLAASTDRPERVVGWHWASPPVISAFAEIVRTKQTDESTVVAVRDLAARCGKNPVVINDTAMHWGFVANRVYSAMIREAARCVDEGIASHAEVDQLMVDCFRWPVGPFGMTKGATTGWKK
ncbi:MAG: 3-hydroxyacyl-CoA dehydrogenase family protein [Myxococcota bacterium]|jgi:3-hydroxyacyl-CoA dehydrogenase|nr:3-hydroxyacyl-CoA dehydrogenase family protein [Myxococcota bacterium]